MNNSGKSAESGKGKHLRRTLTDSLNSDPFACYVLALNFLGIAILARLALDPWLGNTLSYPTVFIAILLASWYCGIGPALLNALIGYVAVEFLIHDAPFEKGSLHYIIASIGLYAGLTAIIVAFVSSFRRERDKLRQAESALEQTEEQFHQLAAHIAEGFWITDVKEHRVIYASPACERIHGAPLPRLPDIVTAWKDTLYPEDRERALAAHRRMTTEAVDVQYRVFRADRSVRWVHVRGYPIRNAEGAVYRVAGTIEDITDRRNLEDRLHHQAHFDNLTGLPNRALFFDRLGQALNQAKRGRHAVGLLFVDVDRLKHVNDTLGHPIGDLLLRRVATCLTESVRAEDTVARLGGDEFGIILPHVEREEHAALVAQKALGLLAEPFQLQGRELVITASIGVAISSAAAVDAQTLVKNADTAMFRAKNSGRNRYECYTADMNGHALEQLDLDSRLRRAVAADDFVLHFQPKKDLATGLFTGCEALLRWKTPDGKLVGPLEFVPALEETGLIRTVGEWILRAACKQIAEWTRAAMDPLPKAVNESAKQFSHSDLAGVVESVLREHAIEARLLELEVTQAAAMQNPERTAAELRKLKALGVTVTIDNFGVGHSSLSFLKTLPIDALKIDRSFVMGLPGNKADASITKAIITLAHNLGVKAIAEGVEHETQLAFLAENGCDEIQGYLLRHPAPGWEIAAIAREQARDPSHARRSTLH